jgi:tRNA(Ile)-lysidine synthase
MNISMLGSFVKILTGPCAVGESDSVLACCSGGVDSMVLLDLLVRAAVPLGLRLGAVHVDHGIRGAASRSDARFVQRRCREIGIACHVHRLSLGPETPNLEETARKRRYEAVRSCMADHGYGFAATGHTMDDQAETVIYRFIRGSGVRGLGGMEAKNPWNLIRPLLGFGREQVETYAAQQGISFVEDATNHDVKLARNLIRHEIIPAMKKINPLVVRSACRLAAIAREEGNLVEDLAAALQKASCEYDWGIVRAYRLYDLAKAQQPVTQRVVIRVLSDMLDDPRGIDASQVEGIMEVVKGEKRAHTVKRRIRAQRDSQSITFCRAGRGPFYELPVDAPGTWMIEPLHQCAAIQAQDSGFQGLTLRSLLPGDRIGRERAVRILAEGGVAKALRPFWPVLVSDGRIVSLPGVRDAWPEAGLKTEFPCHG